jgi:hypothetical protein
LDELSDWSLSLPTTDKVHFTTDFAELKSALPTNDNALKFNANAT